jgi:hypothetical protein
MGPLDAAYLELVSNWSSVVDRRTYHESSRTQTAPADVFAGKSKAYTAGARKDVAGGA